MKYIVSFVFILSVSSFSEAMEIVSTKSGGDSIIHAPSTDDESFDELAAILVTLKTADLRAKKEFACDECSYSVDKKYLLERHLKTHLIARPFACRICDARFPALHGLKTHFDRHMNPKEFACPSCDYTTSIKSNLTRHRKNNHKRY